MVANWARMLTSSVIASQLLVSGCASMICDSTERAVLEEFPQYSDAPATEASFDTGACARYYQVAVPRETLRSYFVSELSKRGWRIEEGSGSGTLITARRATCSYVVYVETPGPDSEATTNVAAHVSCD